MLNGLIPERHRSLVKELVTFAAVGGVNTALGQILFNVFFGMGALTANTISTAIATVCSFVLNRHITYRHRARTSLRRELPLFVGLNLIGLGIQLGILDGARRIFDLDSADRLGLNIARFGGVAVGTVFLLITYRTLVFKKKAEVTVPSQVVHDDEPITPIEAVLGLPPDDEDDAEFSILTEPLEAELSDETPARRL